MLERRSERVVVLAHQSNFVRHQRRQRARGSTCNRTIFRTKLLAKTYIPLVCIFMLQEPCSKQFKKSLCCCEQDQFICKVDHLLVMEIDRVADGRKRRRPLHGLLNCDSRCDLFQSEGVERRYRHFVWLDECLKESYPFILRPPLPEPRKFGSFSMSY